MFHHEFLLKMQSISHTHTNTQTHFVTIFSFIRNVLCPYSGHSLDWYDGHEHWSGHLGVDIQRRTLVANIHQLVPGRTRQHFRRGVLRVHSKWLCLLLGRCQMWLYILFSLQTLAGLGKISVINTLYTLAVSCKILGNI